MGFVGLFYPWGIILQAMALLHFVRRRPDTFWLWIILIGGGLGALVYIVAEVVPDASLLRGPLRAFPRRRRISFLEAAIVDNPAVGNQGGARRPVPGGRKVRARARTVQLDHLAAHRFDRPVLSPWHHSNGPG